MFSVVVSSALVFSPTDFLWREPNFFQAHEPHHALQRNNIFYEQDIVEKMAPLYILTETSAGFALFQAKDKKILKNEALAQETETAEGICSLYVPHIVATGTQLLHLLTSMSI